jgi:hypothetical protein
LEERSAAIAFPIPEFPPIITIFLSFIYLLEVNSNGFCLEKVKKKPD